MQARALRLVASSLLALGALLPTAAPVQAAGADAPSVSKAALFQLKQAALATGAELDASDAVLGTLAAGQPQTMLVEVVSRKVTALDPPRPNEHAAEKQDLLNAVAGAGISRVLDYSYLPMMAVKINNGNALLALMRHLNVKGVYENRANAAFLTQSLPLIHQPSAVSAGYTGAGYSVAVLDTGVDYTRAAFGSCSAPNTPATCRVPYVYDFSTSPTGVRTDDGSLDDNGHGTNVSGIVAGVAPGAKVIGLDVFYTDGLAYSTGIVDAINWVIANKDVYNIRAINMSLGGGRYTSACTGTWANTPIANAKAAGILVAVASGNNAYTDSISSPACVAEAVSVGAVYDSNVGSASWAIGCTDSTTAADKVTCFSNSASFLDILAPGSIIDAAGISESGTSQATPHVAGAAAVVASAHPTYTAQQIEDELKNNGVSVLDTRNNVTKPRLDLGYLGSIEPDLIVTSLTASPSVPSGGIVSASVTVKNQGNTTAAASLLRLYFSTDQTITSGDTYWTACSVPSLAANATYSCAPDVTAPNLPAGTYYVGAIADAQNAVVECNESNNTLAASAATRLGIPDDHFPPGSTLPSGYVNPAGSNAAWTVVTSTAYAGSSSLRSGAILDSQSSDLSYTGSFSSGSVSFARKVSSEVNYDELQFFIDGALQAHWSGEQDWAVVSYPITAGTHTLLWRYMKDSSLSSGSDAGWIDSVTFPTAATATPKLGDFNADGMADLLWNNASTGQTSVWLMNGLSMAAGVQLRASTTWKAVAVGDLDGDGKADILWNNAATGQTEAWLMNGMSMISSAVLLTDTASKPVGMGDLNGDGKADIIWYNATTGQTSAWLMNGFTMTSSALLLTNTAWKVVGVGDLNGDGKADLIWNNASTGQTSGWLMNGLTMASGALLLANTAWKVVAVGDIDGDGKADLIWNNAGTGQSSAWLMNGLTETSGALLLTNTAWKPVGARDLNGDGKADLVWYNATTGQTSAWLMNGFAMSSGAQLLSNRAWAPVAP